MVEHERRDLFEIWRVQKPSYVATVAAAYPLDFSEKVYRASKLSGPKLFIALSPCPPGWDFEPEWSVEVARLAVETGIWPLKEAIHGAVSHTYVPRKFKPVEEYLKRQGRFRHLFEPKRDAATIAHIQATVDDYWQQSSPNETTTREPVGAPPRATEDPMQSIFGFADDLGPIKIVHIYDPKSGLKAVVAVDNVARGPSIGGIRMAPDVSAEEAFRLARAMSLTSIPDRAADISASAMVASGMKKGDWIKTWALWGRMFPKKRPIWCWRTTISRQSLPR